MKKSFLLLLMLLAGVSYGQSVNDYKAVIIPLKYEFLKTDNQYRLNTLTKFNFNNAGFVSFYATESVPAEYNDRCSLLYADVEKESGFLITKLYVILKDCNGKVVFKSAVGKSKEKDYQKAYMDALNDAFQSVYDLQYKYSGVAPKKEVVSVALTPLTPAVNNSVVDDKKQSSIVAKDTDLLYAQVTPTGYQLIDSAPKVVMKLMKTSQANSFIAIKDGIQGSLILKENQWFFEYYQNDQLVSEKVNVKF